jgi:phosphoadenosine phosphosulfate reductase
LIENAVDPGNLTPTETAFIGRNSVGEIEIALTKPIAADLYVANPQTGRLVLDLDGRISGGGLILALDAQEEVRSHTSLTPAAVNADTGTRLPASASQLSELLRELSPAQRLARLRRDVDGTIVFTTSFGLEDQVILHLVAEQNLDIELVTLDTGRLFQETYDLWAATERRYSRRVRAIYPNHEALEALVGKYGINGFYDSREARLGCCHVRKVEPLNRALKGASAWVVGLRADQSDNRGGTDVVTLDPRKLLKVSPLLDWSRDQTLSFANGNGIPINPLHAQSYASIGCAPCTRAIEPGEPERAGRWWWEQDDKKECGLHR